MSKVMRSVKNVTKGYSSIQVKVRNATSNDPWGPTGTEMQEIAQMTFNSSNEFYEIMDMLDKRMNDKGKNWRHVLKALKVLDYCLHEGSELVVTWARKNLFLVKTLREFQYIDEDGRDVGQNVRVSAKELTSLIVDEERLRAERSDRKSWKSRVTGIEEFQSGGGGGGEGSSSPRRPRERQPRAQRENEEDAEYQLAIEASKYQEEEDRKKRQSRGANGDPEDDDLAKAIKLSQEEEELRRRELEDSNAASLFDDAPAQNFQAQPTGYNQGYQQQGQVDWMGNPIDQMQQQQTGYPNYAQPQQTGLQNQPTGYGQYQNGFQQPQPTGYDMYGQGSGFDPQQTGFNPYAQQQQQQQQQPEPIIPANTNNPWATSNQHTQSPLQPTPTGSNNPFASAVNNNSRPFPSTVQSQPTLATLQEQKTLSQLNSNNFNPPTSFSPGPSKTQTPYESKLSALLESGEGQDTFGNTGNLRIPAQHTAPGTFVNSAGAGSMGRLATQQTGNPYMQSQFTGMPATSYGGNQSGAFGGRQVPAATGPANMGMGNGFGGGAYGNQGSNNPFGQRPNQQQQNGQGGDLIQF